MTRVRSWVLVVLVAVSLASARGLAQKPEVPDLLKTLGDYIDKYSNDLKMVTADELYLQMDTAGNQMNKVERLNCDFVMVGLGSGTLFAFRDAYAIDTKPMRERAARLADLFLSPPPPPVSSVVMAQKLTDDSAFWYVNRNLQILDSPLAPLELLRSINQAGSTFKLDGTKKSDGVDLATLKFNETRKPSVLNTPANIPVSGKVTFEIATGIVRQTQITISDVSMNSSYSVKYALDKGTNLWLPSEMDQQIQVKGTSASTFVGTGSFEAHAKYTNYKQVPIDLSKIR